MKIALLIPTYNRPNYLKQLLWSLERADLSLVDTIMFIDDCSTDVSTPNLIENSKVVRFKDSYINYHRNTINKGIKATLQYGYDYLFGKGFDIVINFDSDAIIRPDAVEKLVEAYEKTGNGILTGFHSVTKNANGSERHIIKYDFEDIYFKQSVGGINMCIGDLAYERFVKPALLGHSNWDHQACIRAGGAWCLRESVVQHIGFDSSLNHTEQPDIADDFYYYDLPSVTLFGVDNQPERLKRAADTCTKWIRFGEVKLLHPDIRSKEAYSTYMITEAHKHINTTHALIFQHDGYVHNWQAWDDDWLQYDYIGAPWHYNDGMAVGNGGFSLRSKRFMEACSRMVKIHHPEDHHICRTYRKQLEAEGMKFAPIEVAERFSFEGYLQPEKTLTTQFGRHGNVRTTPGPALNAKRYVVGQFASLGDILWLIPLVRELQNEGNYCLWPVNAEYVGLRKHFPDINFVDRSTVPINYDCRFRTDTQYGIWLPYRFASENMGLPLKYCMTAKYTQYGHSPEIFRQLYWKRGYESERELERYLELPDEYVLVNRKYGAQGQYSVNVPDQKLPVVEMRPIPGFTILDWCGVIEKAEQIHTANTSLLYILEIMKLDQQIHLYSRKGLWGENGFEYTSFLHSKPYILHI
jgi:glycosyltransferase involved in cell wall biosynthesis